MRGGLQINVKSGRAWFNDTWSENDAVLPLTTTISDPLLDRIDTVVLEVNKALNARANSIFIKEGTPSSTPVPPTLENGPEVFQHALANITVRANSTEILPTDITILVGTGSCPFVTGILETASIEQLFAAWGYQFNTWFDDLKDKLSGDVAANLQHEIEELQDGKVNISDKASSTNITQGTSGKWIDAEGLKNALIDQYELGDVSESNMIVRNNPLMWQSLDGSALDMESGLFLQRGYSVNAPNGIKTKKEIAQMTDVQNKITSDDNLRGSLYLSSFCGYGIYAYTFCARLSGSYPDYNERHDINYITVENGEPTVVRSTRKSGNIGVTSYRIAMLKNQLYTIEPGRSTSNGLIYKFVPNGTMTLVTSTTAQSFKYPGGSSCVQFIPTPDGENACILTANYSTDYCGLYINWFNGSSLITTSSTIGDAKTLGISTTIIPITKNGICYSFHEKTIQITNEKTFSIIDTPSNMIVERQIGRSVESSSTQTNPIVLFLVNIIDIGDVFVCVQFKSDGTSVITTKEGISKSVECNYQNEVSVGLSNVVFYNDCLIIFSSQSGDNWRQKECLSINIRDLIHGSLTSYGTSSFYDEYAYSIAEFDGGFPPSNALKMPSSYYFYDLRGSIKTPPIYMTNGLTADDCKGWLEFLTMGPPVLATLPFHYIKIN